MAYATLEPRSARSLLNHAMPFRGAPAATPTWSPDTGSGSLAAVLDAPEQLETIPHFLEPIMGDYDEDDEDDDFFDDDTEGGGDEAAEEDDDFLDDEDEADVDEGEGSDDDDDDL